MRWGNKWEIVAVRISVILDVIYSLCTWLTPATSKSQQKCFYGVCWLDVRCTALLNFWDDRAAPPIHLCCDPV